MRRLRSTTELTFFGLSDTKLPPRAAFTAQIVGTLFGAVLNYVLMNSIIDNQREILLSVEGTNIWSGQQPQQYNSQAVAWGGLAHELFAAGKRYEWVPWSYIVGFAVPVPFWLIHHPMQRIINLLRLRANIIHLLKHYRSCST